MKNESRNSSRVKLGRVFQVVSPMLSFIDYPFRKMKNEANENVPAIFIVAPPRSGSTITYQLVAHCIENFHLTNIWNLLYSTPVLGSVISEKICKHKTASYTSKHGFVPGLCGEAEGLRFWEYWTGQGLEQKPQHWKQRKTSKLSKLIGKLYNTYEKPFLSGYLAHAFCIKLLRQHFPGAIFLHVTRDLLSNAYSIYKVAPSQWFSLLPKRCHQNTKSRYRQIVQQIIEVHAAILEVYSDDVLNIRYESLCEDPSGTLDKIIEHAGKNNITLEKIAEPPDQFDMSRIDPNLNDHTVEISRELEHKLNELEHKDKVFFNSLMETKA